jgi:2-polyprenyl-3-methyl-5-hydroxy-6-metoxy-1,4-benzoquinol methylase
MGVTYDKYYQTENLFGKPYPQLIDFFREIEDKGKVLDVGCGQGRDAIALARLGFDVTGIDHSKVGIDQIKQVALSENLAIHGVVNNIFEFSDFKDFDFILLDSMFHFAKKDRKKEMGYIKSIISNVKKGCHIIFCIQDMIKKVDILNATINAEGKLDRILEKKFIYVFEDAVSGHKSKTDYRMIVAKK